MKEENRMTNNQTQALLEAIEIIIELSETKEQANAYVERISKKLAKKEPTENPQK